MDRFQSYLAEMLFRGALYQHCSSHPILSNNMAARGRGRGLYLLYIYIENFQNLLVRNQLSDLNIIR